MKRLAMFNLIFILIALLLLQCNSNTITETVKLQLNDPFKSTIVKSQFFEIDSKQDNVVEGENGTIIVCPKGCFRNAKGEVVEDQVKIELSEAFSFEDMLLSNLTTTSDGKLLETDGMIYFNAESNGEQLLINEENSIYVEIPTERRKPGMMLYKGNRDDKGNMNWVDPKELDNFLIPVDINSLDFLPEGFSSEVEKGMPFKNHKTAAPELTDSLYYILSHFMNIDLLNGLNSTYDNEPYYKRNDKLLDHLGDASNNYNADTIKRDSVAPRANCGIDPAIIKVIKSEKYQNTFIATHEFETRLKIIFKTCKDSVLKIYINNLDKNLYEADSMAAVMVYESEYYHDFLHFSEQRLTKVKDQDKYSKLLRENFNKQFAKINLELEQAKEKVKKSLQEKNEEFKKVSNDYKKLLVKREKFRMEKYGFTMTQTGWVNIDIGTEAKDWDSEPLEVTIENGFQFNRVYTYVIYESLKSLYRLNSSNNQLFYVGSESEKEMLMPKKKAAMAISIGYKNESPSLAIKVFQTAAESKLSMLLLPSDYSKIKEAIKPFENYSEENKINTDLEFMAVYFSEIERQKELKKESEFVIRLKNIAFPCCTPPIDGKALFFSNCSSCHAAGNDKVIGPGLAVATRKYTREWLYQWTTNSQLLILQGDSAALKLFNDYNKTIQPAFDLSREEIEAIYYYIDHSSEVSH